MLGIEGNETAKIQNVNHRNKKRNSICTRGSQK